MSKLPGVVDADHWKRPAKSRKKPSPATKPIPVFLQKVHEWVMALNQVPEAQLTDKSGPAPQAISSLRMEDGPDYAKLRMLLGRTDVRQSLGAGTKGMLAEQLSPRWDGFTLAGNLWLGALRSTNPDISAEARQQLVRFIQPAHIPALINLLKVPGPNVLAFEILQEVTGHKSVPDAAKWSAWWKASHGKVDVVAHVVNQSQAQLKEAQVRPFDPASFWYAPEDIAQTDRSYESRSTSDQNVIGRWSDAARGDVKRYLDQWAIAKPLLERMVHQPDSRVADYLKTLLSDPGMGEYISVVLAWRGDRSALRLIQESTALTPTVGRLLALGTLGDKTSLQNLLKIVEAHKAPLSYPLMDAELRGYASRLPALGIISAEQAFELLAHERFGLVSAVTAREKKKALKRSQQWLAENFDALSLDKRHGYYISSRTRG